MLDIVGGLVLIAIAVTALILYTGFWLWLVFRWIIGKHVQFGDAVRALFVPKPLVTILVSAVLAVVSFFIHPLLAAGLGLAGFIKGFVDYVRWISGRFRIPAGRAVLVTLVSATVPFVSLVLPLALIFGIPR